jgi:peptidoglycan/LPS O-acetylase OafA/YrhL
MPFTRAWEFLAGVLVAQIRRKSDSRRISEAGGLLGLILIVLSALSFQNISSFPGIVVLVPVIGTSLVLFFSSGSTGLGRTLSRKWLVWIGDRSYGWYLWHWPLIQFVKPFWPNNTIASALAGVSAIIPAAISYRYLENRFRYQRHWSKPGRMVVLVSASLLLPVAAGISSRPLMPELGPHLDATTGWQMCFS